MTKKNIYRITIMNWDKHQGSLKKGHKKILISTGFLTDAKIRRLTPVTRLLYLSCLLVAGESTQSQIEVSHESLVYQSSVKSGSLQSQLDLLQSLQLLTWENLHPLINRKEEKRKEEKRIEVPKGTQLKKSGPIQDEFLIPKDSANASPPANLGQQLVGIYCNAWKARYKSSPPLRPQDTKALKSMGEANGFEKSKALLEAYLRMNETWYLKKRHDLSSFLNNLTSVAQFLETGRVMTNQDLKSFDRAMSNNNTLRALENGEI